MTNIERKEIAPNVFFNSVKVQRFKTMKLSCTAYIPLTKETAAMSAMLSQVLTKSCEEYPTLMQFSRKLGSLYGATVSGGANKSGDVRTLKLVVSAIDDRFALGGESVAQDVSKLLCEVLFKPKVKNGKFDSEDLEQERRQLIEYIDAQFNDKQVYAALRCTEIMCDGEPYGITRHGGVDTINKIDCENLYRGWQELLKTARFEIFFVGGKGAKEAENVFKEAFSKVERQPVKLENKVVYDVKEVKNVTEEMELSQSKLIIGMRTGVDALDPRSDAMKLMSAVLGGTAHSKLFNNVREKLSLCYYCSSRYDSRKGILRIESGVESENIEKAEKAIFAEIDEMKKGNITDFEMESAKLSICDSYRTLDDSVDGIEAWYSMQVFDDKFKNLDEKLEGIMKVTKEQVIEAANLLKTDTIYVLKGNQKEG